MTLDSEGVDTHPDFLHLFDPFDRSLLHSQMSLPSVLDALLGYSSQLDVESIQKGQRRGGRSLVLHQLRHESVKGEVPATARGILRSIHHRLGRHPECQSRWQRQGLLGSGEYEVDPPFVGSRLQPGDPGNRVDEQQRLLALIDHRRNGLQVLECAGRGFGMRNGHRVISPGGESVGDLFRRVDVSPGDLPCVDVETAGKGDLGESARESTVDEAQYPTAHNPVANRRLH